MGKRTGMRSEPFSLSCVGCDAGMEITSLVMAWVTGWARLENDEVDDGMWWTHLGWCPECQAEGKA